MVDGQKSTAELIPSETSVNRTEDLEKVKIEQELEREFSRKRTRGFIIDCDGERAVVSADVEQESEDKENYWAVGQLITIKVGLNRVVGLSYKVEVPTNNWNHGDANKVHIHLELVGEIISKLEEPDRFTSGITSYPQMGCVAHRIRASDLATIYQSDGDSVIKVGHLTQDHSVDAKIDLDKLLSRHFAVVGTTGVGKSTAVTLLLRKVVEKRPDIRVMVLDPHNEFASAFSEHAIVVDSSNLQLPFWLFKLEEFVEVVFRGQKGFDSEVELLRDLIPLAKERYKQASNGNSSQLVRRVTKSNLTADMPVPYRMVDLLKLIDERLGLLEGKAEKPLLKSLQHRLETISSDPRFRFMFDVPGGGDVMEAVISKLFRLPKEDKPICVLEMSGLPSEVVNSVASVLARMAFDLAMNSEGAIQTLVVCEEAHRYVPSDPNACFWPTRQAIARIAKEGRKYGVYLGIITQRPGELDPTILSQCNTVFAMRLGNQKDQDIIRGAVSNGAKSTIGFLSSISNRECIAFGEAIHTPMRMTFETIAAEDLPGAHIYAKQEAVKSGLDISVTSVVRRMRQLEHREQMDESQEFAAELGSSVGSGSAPGGEINEILDVAYAAETGSFQSFAPKDKTQMSQSGGATPQMGTDTRIPERRVVPGASPTGAERRTGVDALIRNFRG